MGASGKNGDNKHVHYQATRSSSHTRTSNSNPNRNRRCSPIPTSPEIRRHNRNIRVESGLNTVLNTPEGLIINGQLQSDNASAPALGVIPGLYPTNKAPVPGFNHVGPSPTNFPFAPQGPGGNMSYIQGNLSSVAAGAWPNPNQQHFQPQVPDTTNGPQVHTYIPRFDPPGTPHYSMGPYGPQFVQPDGTQFMQPMQPMHPGFAPFQQVGNFAGPQQPMFPQQGIPEQAFLPQQAPAFQAMPGPQVYMPNAQSGMPTAPIGMMPQGQPPMMMPQMPQMPQMGLPQQAMGPPPPAFMAGGQGVPGMVPAGYGVAGVGGNPAPFPGAPAPFPGSAPDIMGIGKTGTEAAAEQAASAVNSQAMEPQDMKPGDDDPSRMYWCRELDGAWLLRSRFSIDRLEDCRWYVWETGVFYAVRIAD
ncbi:Uu.00g057880.m01.CDS01 [Anthostomella pinea]|uniref:Uu.00g057880.m01.CDS01 n=1 Tax=Anthostomella pinea TaxID=933095 RepID=A0AAI8YM34_9PEZI|nr:Uu.00g057880.m01.CDS01 [Anthostomella pinea]